MPHGLAAGSSTMSGCPQALCKSPSWLPRSTMEARASGQCSLSRRRWHGANLPLRPATHPAWSSISMDHAASDGAITRWQIYLTPRPASVHLTARELTSRKRSSRLISRPGSASGPPDDGAPGQGPSEGDIGLEAATSSSIWTSKGPRTAHRIGTTRFIRHGPAVFDPDCFSNIYPNGTT